jgi:hypothetical protein
MLAQPSGCGTYPKFSYLLPLCILFFSINIARSDESQRRYFHHLCNKECAIAVPFGFSIGDFFGAAGVLSQVMKALRKHGGAEDNYRAICVEVELFGNTLKEVELLTANDTNKNHIEAILEHSACCKVELERFLEKLSNYDDSLGENVERKTWSEKARGNAKKAKWALFMHEWVSEVRDVIRRAGDGISMRLLL